jgi:hypothetical protein
MNENKMVLGQLVKFRIPYLMDSFFYFEGIILKINRQSILVKYNSNFYQNRLDKFLESEIPNQYILD